MGGVDIEDPARVLGSASRNAARSPWVERMARYGLVAKGVSYGLVGALAIAVAVSDTGRATSREGALALLADESYGPFLIGALALGFASYALWRLAEAILDRGGEGTDAEALAKRAGYLGRALVYGALTCGAVQLLLGRNESGNREQQRAAARVFDRPAGRWLVGLAGLARIGAGLYNAFRWVTQKFEEKWKTSGMSPAERRWLPRASSVGLLSRCVVFSLIGVFVVKAAYEYDPRTRSVSTGRSRSSCARATDRFSSSSWPRASSPTGSSRSSRRATGASRPCADFCS